MFMRAMVRIISWGVKENIRKRMDFDEYRIDKFLHITLALELAPLGLQTAVPRQAFSCCKITVLWIPINENFKTLKKLYLLLYN